MKGEIVDLNRSVNVSKQLQQQQETAGQLQLTRFDVTVLQAQVADIPVRVKPKAVGAAEGTPGEDVAAAAVSAAQGLDVKLGELRKAAKRAYDRVYYGDVLPPIGSFQISYARSALSRGSAAGWHAGQVRQFCSPRQSQTLPQEFHSGLQP